MRTFIDKRKTSKKDEVGSKIANSYIELEFPVDETSACVVYIVPRSATSIFVASCWGHAFDAIVKGLDKQMADVIKTTWPLLAALLANGIKDKYSDGALIILEDFDDSENKWFVATTVDNLPLKKPEAIFGERTTTAIQLVFEKSMGLLKELSENKPGTMPGLGKKGNGELATKLLRLLGSDPEDVDLKD